jgi:retinol dehydrogenase 12
MVPASDEPTEDGYDLTFGTNALGESAEFRPRYPPLNLFLGHFYFTKLLLPALLNTPAGHKARVINTTSFVHLFGSSFVGSGLDFDTFKDGPKRRRMGKVWLYGQSKFVRHPLYGFTTTFSEDAMTLSLRSPRTGKHPLHSRAGQKAW